MSRAASQTRGILVVVWMSCILSLSWLSEIPQGSIKIGGEAKRGGECKTVRRRPIEAAKAGLEDP